MKKSNLKNMMIVEIRGGKKFVVVGDRLYFGGGYIPLEAFTDDLKHANRAYESEDIVKVYAPINFLPTTADLDCVEQLCALEWEREDNLELSFNGKAVYTGQGQTRDDGYTVGKVYEFVKGSTTDDDGMRRPACDIPYLSESELKTFGFLKLIE